MPTDMLSRPPDDVGHDSHYHKKTEPHPLTGIDIAEARTDYIDKHRYPRISRHFHVFTVHPPSGVASVDLVHNMMGLRGRPLSFGQIDSMMSGQIRGISCGRIRGMMCGQMCGQRELLFLAPAGRTIGRTY
jgi:hypothetical protein